MKVAESGDEMSIDDELWLSIAFPLSTHRWPPRIHYPTPFVAMEPAGVAIGIVGLASLFSSVLTLVDSVHTYKTFAADSEALRVQFEADRVRFHQWGREVKLNPERFSLNESTALALDPERYAAVQDLLNVLERILQGAYDAQPAGHDDDLTSRHARPLHNSAGESMRHKFKWAVRGKNERKDQVKLFGTIVQKLFDLVPLANPDSVAEGESVPQPGVGSSNLPGLDDVVQILNRIEADRKCKTVRISHCLSSMLTDSSGKTTPSSVLDTGRSNTKRAI